MDSYVKYRNTFCGIFNDIEWKKKPKRKQKTENPLSVPATVTLPFLTCLRRAFVTDVAQADPCAGDRYWSI